uniref:SSD domain-containing protein n=1 Tax=Parascaris equorum TaxID=6256 RepID=A0A914RR38_PAREQ
ALSISILFVANKPALWDTEDISTWDREVSRYYHGEYNSSLINWTYHKISYAINACICPMLAAGAALGTLFWFGFRFGSVLYVTPLLVLAIGVDDSFIMINAWERLCDARRGKSLPSDTLAERLAKLLVDVGPSITITSLTNVAAFGISSFSPTPEVSLFCIGNMVAMLFDYLYTISLYPAIMMLSAKYELRMELSRRQKSQGECMNNMRIAMQNLLSSYCEWLSSKLTLTFIILLMTAYWSINKLFLLDSPLMEASRIQNAYFFNERTEPLLFITKVANLSDPIRIIRMNKIVEDFELLPESSGAELTRYWIRDYEVYLSTDTEEGSELDDGDAIAFKPYSMEIGLNIAIGEDSLKWTTQLTALINSSSLSLFTAKICHCGPKGATVFMEGSEFSDQIPVLLPATIQTSICTLISMTIICCLFMYDKLAVLIASASVLSIFIGLYVFSIC